MERHVISMKEMWDVYRKGEAPGHPFRGNQYVDYDAVTEGEKDPTATDYAKRVTVDEKVQSFATPILSHTAATVSAFPKLASLLKETPVSRIGIFHAFAANVNKANGFTGVYSMLSRKIDLYVSTKASLTPNLKIGDPKQFSVSLDVQSAVLHEIGHHVTNLFTEGQLSYFREIWEKHGGVTMFDPAIGNWWQKNVSKYAANNMGDAFAECFTAFTHPLYRMGMLPKEIELAVASVTGMKKMKRGLAAIFKGGEGSGEEEGHPFRGNQWVDAATLATLGERIRDEKISLEKPNLEDAARFLETEFAKDHGGPQDPKDPVQIERAVQEGIREFNYQMARENVKDWYDKDMSEAFGIVSKYLPELQDPTKLKIFAAMLAVSSPKNNPIANMVTAAEAFRLYIKDGQIPSKPEGSTETGWSGSNTERAFRMLNAMIQKWGEAATVDWLDDLHDGYEIAEVRKSFGMKGAGSEINLKSIYHGSYAFGPKVGPFYRNVMQVDDITIDAWMVRAYNRHFGKFDYNKEGKITDRITKTGRELTKEWVAKIAQATGSRKCDTQAVLWYFEQHLWDTLGTKGGAPLKFTDGAKRWTDIREGKDTYGNIILREQPDDGSTGRNSGKTLSGADIPYAAQSSTAGLGSGGEEMEGETRRGIWSFFKGEGPGHPFRGNQYTEGESGGGVTEERSPSAGMHSVDVKAIDAERLLTVMKLEDPEVVASMKKLGLSKEDVYQMLAEAKEFNDKTPQTKLAHTDSAGRYTPEREHLHQLIIDEMMKKAVVPPAGEKPLLFLTGGLSGSGKSYLLNRPLYDRVRQGLMIDADEVRAQLAKADGIPKVTKEATSYQDEVDDVLKKVWKEVLERGCSATYDCTMKTMSKTVRIVEAFKKFGYKTEVAFAYVPVEKAMSRGIKRYIEGGRYVDPAFIAAQDHHNIKTLEALKPMVDVYRKWNMDIPMGTDPILMEEGHK